MSDDQPPGTWVGLHPKGCVCKPCLRAMRVRLRAVALALAELGVIRLVDAEEEDADTED